MDGKVDIHVMEGAKIVCHSTLKFPHTENISDPQ